MYVSDQKWSYLMQSICVLKRLVCTDFWTSYSQSSKIIPQSVYDQCFWVSQINIILLTKTPEQAAAKVAQLTGDIAQKPDFTTSQAKNQDEQTENNCKQYTTGLSIWVIQFDVQHSISVVYTAIGCVCGEQYVSQALSHIHFRQEASTATKAKQYARQCFYTSTYINWR